MADAGQVLDRLLKLPDYQKILIIATLIVFISAGYYYGLHASKAQELLAKNQELTKLNAQHQEQQRVLAPLAAEWDTLRPWQREKMLDIAHDYPRMTPQQQERVQQRLNKWSRMTPYERENARKKYQQFRALPPEKQEELRRKWRDYEHLPESEREKLRNSQPESAPEDDLGN